MAQTTRSETLSTTQKAVQFHYNGMKAKDKVQRLCAILYKVKTRAKLWPSFSSALLIVKRPLASLHWIFAVMSCQYFLPLSSQCSIVVSCLQKRFKKRLYSVVIHWLAFVIIWVFSCFPLLPPPPSFFWLFLYAIRQEAQKDWSTRKIKNFSIR